MRRRNLTEIPETQVEHGFAIDDYAWGDSGLSVGEIRTDLNWPKPSNDEIEAFRRELEDRASRRAALGGFGFRSPA